MLRTTRTAAVFAVLVGCAAAPDATDSGANPDNAPRDPYYNPADFAGLCPFGEPSAEGCTMAASPTQLRTGLAFESGAMVWTAME